MKNEKSNMTSPYYQTPPLERENMNQLATEIYNQAHKTQNVEFKFDGLELENQIPNDNHIEIIN